MATLPQQRKECAPLTTYAGLSPFWAENASPAVLSPSRTEQASMVHRAGIPESAAAAPAAVATTTTGDRSVPPGTAPQRPGTRRRRRGEHLAAPNWHRSAAL